MEEEDQPIEEQRSQQEQEDKNLLLKFDAEREMFHFQE